jgi:hypothetical protein
MHSASEVTATLQNNSPGIVEQCLTQKYFRDILLAWSLYTAFDHEVRNSILWMLELTS